MRTLPHPFSECRQSSSGQSHRSVWSTRDSRHWEVKCCRIRFAGLKVQMMSRARERCSCYPTKGHGIVSIVITLLALVGCSAKKIAIDCDDVKEIGQNCKHEPRCIRLKRDEFFCEDKVFVRRFMEPGEPQQAYTKVYYILECMEETKENPYHYLSLILSANFSVGGYRYSNNSSGGELTVSNCSIPSSNQSVLVGGGSAGFFGRRDVVMETLFINCKDGETHFSLNHLSGLENLKELYISCPKLSKVDEDVFSGVSKRLEYLQFIGTEIQHLPERFFSNTEVMGTLDLQRNKLKSFSRTFLGTMRNLKELHLNGNEIESLDDDIFLQTKQLTRLELENNLLTVLPSSVCSLRNLRFLSARYNRISVISQDFFYSFLFPFVIQLSGNRLPTIEHESESIIPTCSKVLSSDETFPNSSTTHEQSRNLNKTWISSVNLLILHLDNNYISSLPVEAFYGMVNLMRLNISSNQISHLPENIFSRNKLLEQLMASNNLFTYIPARLLEKNTGLRELDLSHNLIETLHEDFFSNVTELCHFDISNNRIRHLPEKIFQPFKAQKRIWKCFDFLLDMRRNRLEDLPELSIPELSHLDLSENRLTLFKTEKLLQISRLRVLNLSHNLLHTVENSNGPVENRYPFGKLEVIDLSSNQLTELPSFDIKLTYLKHLNVSGNKFKELTLIFCLLVQRDNCIPSTLDLSQKLVRGTVFRYRLRVAENMKHMDLSHNFIDLKYCHESVDVRRLVWGCFSLLDSFPGLEVIILSHNQIAYIPMEFKHYLPNLRYVDLSHNKIKRLWHGDLLYTRARDDMDLMWFRERSMHFSHNNRFTGSNNLTIDLRHNSISSLQLPDDKMTVVIPGCSIGSQFSRVKLLLGHNPLVCDCDVFKVLRYASLEMRPTSALERRKGHMLVVPAVIDIQDLHCWEPESMKGKAIADVESWAYHWLPMVGICLNHLEVQSKLGKTSAKPTKLEAMNEPPT